MRFGRLAAPLERGLSELEIPFQASNVQQLLQYLELLARWNKKFNLTAITQPEEMVIKHLLDSLSILPYVSGQHIMDVGTGAGLPGIPLSIFCPDSQFHLLDRSSKKTRFIQQAIIELKLNNINPVTARVEQYQPDNGVDMVLSRAFQSLGDVTEYCSHLCHDDGRWLVMKGRYPDQELSQVVAPFCVQDIIALQVPQLNAERHLVVLVKDK